MELQHKELQAHLSKLSSTCRTVAELREIAQTRDKRLEAAKQKQADLESRANILLRKLLTINQPQVSEAEEKWFKELSRVEACLKGPRGLLDEVKSRLTEANKYIELRAQREEDGDESGKRKIDARVMESIEEAYYHLLGLANSRTRKIERLKMRTAKLNSAF